MKIEIFLSHISADKERAATLKLELGNLGFEAFVAHEDIEPGEEWLSEIRKRLNACHALIALLSEGFAASAWCDQEAGWALGRGIPVISVRLDKAPHGFLGATQALKWHSAKQAATDLVGCLLRDPRVGGLIAEEFVTELETADSYAEANIAAGHLVDIGAAISKEQLQRLYRAMEENDQVAGAFVVAKAMAIIEKRASR